MIKRLILKFCFKFLILPYENDTNKIFNQNKEKVVKMTIFSDIISSLIIIQTRCKMIFVTFRKKNEFLKN